MATIAIFRFPPGTFLLGRLFDTYPDTTAEIERVVPVGAAVRPYFWVEGVPGSAIQSLLGAEGGIDGIELVDSVDGRTLIRCDCVSDQHAPFDIIARCDVTLLAADGDADGWTLTLRGTESGAITEFDRAIREAGYDPEICDLHAGTRVPTGHTTLTDRQREALELAFRMGYYDDPRGTTLGDVAAELGISRQALADRLRRGYHTLVRNHVLTTRI